VPTGKHTDFRRAVDARGNEKIVFTWQVWPDKATLEAPEAKMRDDRRFEVSGDIPFNPKRLILGCFIRCGYILGLSRNTTLDALAAPWREQCQWRWKPGLGRVHRFHQFEYAAASWPQEEKVIARVEATGLGTDARFIVTNLDGRAKHLYEKVYCQRGRAENLIKDMKLATRSDKTACSRRQAN
jgi:Transposase DDE domain group 1/Protein of unknown function (DUF1428)